MARNIEHLLRVISDLNRFEQGDCSTENTLFSHISEELEEFDLDLVSAASLENYMSNIPVKQIMHCPQNSKHDGDIPPKKSTQK